MIFIFSCRFPMPRLQFKDNIFLGFGGVMCLWSAYGLSVCLLFNSLLTLRLQIPHLPFCASHAWSNCSTLQPTRFSCAFLLLCWYAVLLDGSTLSRFLRMKSDLLLWSALWHALHTLCFPLFKYVFSFVNSCPRTQWVLPVFC